VKVRVACTLGQEEAGQRVEDWRSALSTSVTQAERPSPERLVLTLTADPSSTEQLVRLARLEKRCCAFFSFKFEIEQEAVLFTIEVPSDASAVLDDFACLVSGGRSRPMSDYPSNITRANLVEPVPRRVRGMLGEEIVFDTTRAHYVWEHAFYPQFYIPVDDIHDGVLVSEEVKQHSPRGEVELYSLHAGGEKRKHAAKVLRTSSIDALKDTVRFEWSALDAWYEEDERIFVHPRNPYVRVDALRSTRTVRVELEGVVLAESSSPVMVFETGLPTRYYLNPLEIDFSHLVPTTTVTSCPYKGMTSGYWSARIGEEVHPDVAWTYDFPTVQLQPIAGMIAFYNEKVDLVVDGKLLERPTTHFSSADKQTDKQTDKQADKQGGNS